MLNMRVCPGARPGTRPEHGSCRWWRGWVGWTVSPDGVRSPLSSFLWRFFLLLVGPGLYWHGSLEHAAVPTIYEFVGPGLYWHGSSEHAAVPTIYEFVGPGLYTDTVLQNMTQCLHLSNLWAQEYAHTVPGSSEHSAVPTIIKFEGPGFYWHVSSEYALVPYTIYEFLDPRL